MTEKKGPQWQTDITMDGMDNLLGNMNESLSLMKQLLQEKRAQLILAKHQHKEKDARRTAVADT